VALLPDYKKDILKKWWFRHLELVSRSRQWDAETSSAWQSNLIYSLINLTLATAPLCVLTDKK
jgi:hypothetical protein